ncbi:MAG: DEAD/DEAH box helicase, partial [Actinomycetota bacterium]|nr:DEAD/DEAH box helicase [Actinomycetota bacterium]
ESARTVVIDEADRMADMGFLPDVRRILDLTPSDRQTLLFSATLDKDVAALTRDYQSDPVRHEVGPETPDIHLLRHHFWAVDRSERVNVAVNLIRRTGKTVVFTRTRHGADRAAKQLGREGLEAAVIHGARTQSQRDRALAHFTDGEALVLVATDVAARGIHVDGVECVLHFDPPEDGKAYVHRSGRTARAGASGTVVCFVDKSQRKAVKHLQREAGIDVQVVDPDLDGFGDARPLSPRPQKTGGQNQQPSRPQGRKPSGGQSRNNGKGKRKPQNGNARQRNGQHQKPGSSGKPAGKGKPGGKAKSGKRKPATGKKRTPQGAKRGNGYPKSKQNPNRKKAARQRHR